ncbi:MAG: TraM recognition domain-containing protein [Candidatus Zambryskibacteria bacterium]|nr:TraM recognition domain-containing protein [Candidatus Zambryskibacteria bacterium]
MKSAFELPKNQFKNPEDEIAHLRRLVAEKEKNLENLGVKQESLKSARETLSQYKKISDYEVLHPEYAINEEEKKEIVLRLSPEEHDKQIIELVRLAEKKGIKNALSVVEKMQNFHLTDDFHRYISEYIKEGFTIPGLNTREMIFKGLDMSLYEILILEEINKSESKSSLEEVISSMEQFYSGMLSISDPKRLSENWMSLEIANANSSEEIVFYVAVPTAKKRLFEKHIISVFHNAKIIEQPDDYNIFNEAGVTLGACAEFNQNPIYPIKTYENFIHDPLNSILSSFSKVNTNGEGAAIQLIWSPMGDKYVKKYKSALDKIREGVPIKEAIDIPDDISSEIVRTFKDLFKSSKRNLPTDEENKQKELIDEKTVEEINKKIAFPITKCNLRILASSKTENEAQEILNSLKSSFNQFENTLGNSFNWKEFKRGDLRSLVRNFTFRIFDANTAIPMNLREMTSIVHFHTKSLGSAEGLRQNRVTSAAAPFNLSPEGILLGFNKHQNKETEIRISTEDRLRHFYCIGQTGTGKSVLLKEMIIQDIEMGHGVCMIDPHGSDIQDILANVPPERFEEVIYFDPAFTARPMALNMLEYDENYPEQKTFVVNELFSIFQKLYGAIPESMGPAFEQYFRNSALLIMDDPASGNTLVDMSRVLSNKRYRDYKISKCKNPLIKQFWINAEQTTGEQGLANYVQYVTSKFDVFLANEIMRPVIAQEKSSFNFRDIMDNQKILLVNLSKGRLGDINSNLIGLILVGKILIAALSRADSLRQNLPPFYLYIDEFQNVTTDSISTILSEARKYRLSLTVAHQFIAQLEEKIKDAVFGNVGSMCAFRVGAEDAEELEGQFEPTFSADDLMNIDNYNAHMRLLVNGKPAKPFNIETLPPSEGNANQVEKLKEMSYLKYGRPRQEVEEMILEKFKGL